MDLFDYMRETAKEKESPLASRMRPTTLEEVVGQQHIIGKGKLLYRAIKADKLSSLIFYGPPGTDTINQLETVQQQLRGTRSHARQGPHHHRFGQTVQHRARLGNHQLA